MFDSPLHFCTACRVYVALDESLQECAVRHHCDVRHCPIAALLIHLDASDTSARTPGLPGTPVSDPNAPQGPP